MQDLGLALVDDFGKTVTVFLQRENDGDYWATTRKQNSDSGYTLFANGSAVKQTWKNGELITGYKCGTWTAKPVEPRRFLGSEIGPAIVEAFDRIPEGREIVEVKAGENMTIEVILAPQEIDVTAEFITYWWDGERWNEYPA